MGITLAGELLYVPHRIDCAATDTAHRPQRGQARPQEPIAAIVEAFRTHDLVAVSDPHGNLQTQLFLRTLVADPRYADAADIVIEVANARYQDVMDRYIRGEQVPIEAVRPAWQNTTVANQIWADDVLFDPFARPMRPVRGTGTARAAR